MLPLNRNALLIFLVVFFVVVGFFVFFFGWSVGLLVGFFFLIIMQVSLLGKVDLQKIFFQEVFGSLGCSFKLMMCYLITVEKQMDFEPGI